MDRKEVLAKLMFVMCKRINFLINQHENADLHTVADDTSLEGPGSELSH